MTTANQKEFGETWVYESIISALPGIDIPNTLAIGIQLVFFETAVLAFAVWDNNGAIAIVGSAAVLLATLGSVEMLRISRLVRSRAVPTSYKRLLFGSKVETVLGVLVYVALITHLFVFEPQQSVRPLLHSLLGANPPIVVMMCFCSLGGISHTALGRTGGQACLDFGEQVGTEFQMRVRMNLILIQKRLAFFAVQTLKQHFLVCSNYRSLPF